MPELLAPAGDWPSARAAVENGADAVYFGLATPTCFNARARAKGVTPEELPERMAWLRQRGVKGYAAVNTLVFPGELEQVETLLRQIAEAGADAVIVQDLGVARLAGELCPGLPLHASTQMTLTSAEAIRTAVPLGIRRVILPRELSLDEIRRIREATDVELEVFVHGALCLSYSGQCLASRTLGARSGNRGQCAQPCRLPYELICDGSPLDWDGRRHPLSTQDLAAYDLVPQLIAAGVSALKIEGRLKSAEYVATVTRHYRRAIDAAQGDRRSEGPEGDRHIFRPETGPKMCQSPAFTPEEIDQLSLSFSRGFCHGWLEGPNHKALVSGRTPASRGVPLGEVRAVGRRGVVVRLTSPVKRGDGVVFESDAGQDARQGGRVYEVFVGRHSIKEPVAAGEVELTFAYGAIDPSKIQPGQQVRKTDDPQWDRQVRKGLADAKSLRRAPVDLVVEAAVGRPLRIAVTSDHGAACRVESSGPLAEALKHPLDEEVLRTQLGRLGSTPYELRRLDARIDGRPMVPLSVLGQLRHAIVEQLDRAATQAPARAIAAGSVVARLHDAMLQSSPAEGGSDAGIATGTQLHVLCRSMAQIERVAGAGAASVIVDLPEVDECGEAVEMVRRAGARVMLATPRIQKPGEAAVFRTLAGFRPDGLLVRNLGGLEFCRTEGVPAVADFPLNAANELTVHWLHQQGASRVTAAVDLDRGQVLDLAATAPPEWLEVVVYQHVPMFHTEHCLYCAVLSPGVDRATCGRPCRRHELRLRDPAGMEHTVAVEAACRNTVFSASPQERQDWVRPLVQRGVRYFRVEFLERTEPAEAERVVERYRQALGGQQPFSPP